MFRGNSQEKTIRKESLITTGVIILLFVFSNLLFFTSSINTAVVFAEEENVGDDGKLNKDVDYNKKLEKLASYPQADEERVIKYLRIERDSIITSPKNEVTEEKGSILGSTGNTFGEIMDVFKDTSIGGFVRKTIKGIIEKYSTSNNTTKDIEFGSGSNTPRQPRLEFKNHDADFTDMQSLIDSADPYDFSASFSASETKLGDLKDEGEKIKEYIRKDPPTEDDPPNMLKITDEKIEGPIVTETERVYNRNTREWETKLSKTLKGKTQPYDMGDTLFKMLEPYALSWKVLYTIDRAIENHQYESFSDITGDRTSSPEARREKLLRRFIRGDIPLFMPKFNVLRHIKRDYKYDYEYDYSCSYSEENGVECEGEVVTDTETDSYTPVYMLEWLDILTKDQFMPSAEKVTYDYLDEKIYHGELGSYTKTKHKYLTYEPTYYKKSDGNGENFISGSNEVIDDKTLQRGYRKTVNFEKLVKVPEEMPKRTTKRKEVKKLFEEKYLLNKYDIKFSLSATESNPYMVTARYTVGWIFGIPVQFDLRGLDLNFASLGNFTVTNPVGSVSDSSTYDSLITKYAQLNGIDPNLIRGLIMRESGFNKNALNPGNFGPSSKYVAVGLMQIWKGEASYQELSNHVNTYLDPEANIKQGVGILKNKLNFFNGNIELGICAYNWGEGNLRDFLNKNFSGVPYSQMTFSKMLPYINNSEVRNHTPAVMAYYQKYAEENGGSTVTFNTGSDLADRTEDVGIITLDESLFDDSKDEQIDAAYEGGPDSWGEDFRRIILGMGASTGTTGPTAGEGGVYEGPVSKEGFVWPVRFSPKITSKFGMRLHPILKVYKLHDGIDITSSSGTTREQPIYAAKDGTVMYTGYSGGEGYHVYIEHDNGVQTRYLHMIENSIKVSAGQQVKAGQTVLGLLGSTGYSTGPHLHFGVYVDGKAANPENYLP